MGFDVVSEKQGRKREALTRIDAEQNALNVSQLADQYLADRIVGRWKHPKIVRSRIERDIKPSIGNLPLADVRPSHIDFMLKGIMFRGSPDRHYGRSAIG